MKSVFHMTMSWPNKSLLRVMKYFTILFPLLLFCGCTKTVTTAQLDADLHARDGNSFPNQGFYVGGDRSYDYFVIRGAGGSSRYRVLQSEGAVTNRFATTEDDSLCRNYGAITAIIVTNDPVVVPK